MSAKCEDTIRASRVYKCRGGDDNYVNISATEVALKWSPSSVGSSFARMNERTNK